MRQSLSNEKYTTTVFGCYIQHCNEVATCKIIDTILLHKFQLALPSIDSNKLSFKIVTKNWRNELELGKFGILEPIKTLPTILPQIVITPVLGFDEKFRRIGYGGIL